MSDGEPDRRAAWGFPAFARDFPESPELDALVDAFARGDFRAVRAGAEKLAASDADEAVKRAAARLVEGTRPDPAAKYFFVLAAALLLFLAIWWMKHDHPEGSAPAAVPTKSFVH